MRLGRFPNYLCVGGAVGAGTVLVGCDLTPCNTDFGPPFFVEYSDSVIEVIMNSTADQVVAFESVLADPRGPNAVWLPCPPKAAERSPLVPLCSSTTMMMKKQVRTCTVVIK